MYEVPPRIFVWGEPAFATLVLDATAESGGSIVGCGGPTPAQSAELASALEAERDDDLRTVLQRDDFDSLLLATTAPMDRAVRAAIADSGVFALTTEPQPGDYADVVDDPPRATIPVGPLFRFSPGLIAATTVFEDEPRPHTLHVAMRAAAGDGSLFARLFDAVDIVTALLGSCETVTASLSGQHARSAETLAGLAGDLTMHMRCPDGAAAVVAIATGAPDWFRGMTAVASHGVMRITDTVHDIVTSETCADPSSFCHHHAQSPGVLLGAQMRRMRDQPNHAGVRGRDAIEILACCEAARVSCRTGNTESAMRFVEMLQR